MVIEIFMYIEQDMCKLKLSIKWRSFSILKTIYSEIMTIIIWSHGVVPLECQKVQFMACYIPRAFPTYMDLFVTQPLCSQLSDPFLLQSPRVCDRLRLGKIPTNEDRLSKVPTYLSQLMKCQNRSPRKLPRNADFPVMWFPRMRPLL